MLIDALSEMLHIAFSLFTIFHETIFTNIASLVNKFMKQENKKIKNIVYVAAHATTFFFLLTKTFYETRDL